MTKTLPIPVGAVVRYLRAPLVRFLVDSNSGAEYGITVACVNGYATWARPDEVEEVCRCPQVSDGHNGWRCLTPHAV